MDDLGRRDFLAAFVQAILLALFPWLRGREEAAAQLAEGLLSPGEVQTYSLICARYWRIEPEPLCFIAKLGVFRPAAEN